MHVLFDLDGTLTDSSRGIMRCYAHALDRLGVQATSLSQAVCVGPPLPVVFQALLGSRDSALIDQAIRLFRERFEPTGMFENTLYPEVREALAALQLHGHRMRIVTAKPQPYAMRILQHFRIEGFFEAVHGPSLQDRTHNKAKLVEDALRATGSRHQTVMVGDRAEDILAARVNGIAAIAATWGYGSATELAEVNPDGVAENMGHVIHIVERWARAGSGPQYKEPVSEVLDRIDNG